MSSVSFRLGVKLVETTRTPDFGLSTISWPRTIARSLFPNPRELALGDSVAASITAHERPLDLASPQPSPDRLLTDSETFGHLLDSKQLILCHLHSPLRY